MIFMCSEDAKAYYGWPQMDVKKWLESYQAAKRVALTNDPKAILASASHLARIQRINEAYDNIEAGNKEQ